MGNRKEDEKARPLLVRISSEGEKCAVFSRAKHLRNSNELMSRVFVNRDISREERKKYYKLGALLTEKRRNGGDVSSGGTQSGMRGGGIRLKVRQFRRGGE